MKIISFYTEPNDSSNFYTENSKRFIKECEKYGLDYHIEELESKKNYYANTKMKPYYIQSCLEKFNEPLIWMDIDTSILKKPNFLLDHLDFAAVKHEKKTMRIHAYCLFFNNNENSHTLIRNWINSIENDTSSIRGDHSHLCEILPKTKNLNWDFMEEFTKIQISPKSLK